MSTSYLVDPSTFPATAEGEPWGSESVSLSVAGEELRIQGLSRSQKRAVEGLWSGFKGGAPEAVSIALFRVEPKAFRSFDKRGWSYELLLDYGPESTHVTGIDLMARIDWRSGLTAALWVATEDGPAFQGAFENFLRVLLAHALLFRGGFLVHSAAVVDRRGGRLFVGPSGAGKSTVSRLALDTGRFVVSDDLNLVAPDGTLRGSPFLGDVGARTGGSHPLLGIYRLEKGDREAVRPMGEGETVASLTACAPYVNRSPFLGEALWSSLSALVKRVPGRVLTFRRDGDFWPLLESC